MVLLAAAWKLTKQRKTPIYLQWMSPAKIASRLSLPSFSGSTRFAYTIHDSLLLRSNASPARFEFFLTSASMSLSTMRESTKPMCCVQSQLPLQWNPWTQTLEEWSGSIRRCFIYAARLVKNTDNDILPQVIPSMIESGRSYTLCLVTVFLITKRMQRCHYQCGFDCWPTGFALPSIPFPCSWDL